MNVRVNRFIGDKGVIRSSLESRYLNGHVNIDWVLASPQQIWGAVDIEYALNKMPYQKLFSKVYFIAPENGISQMSLGARVTANNKWTYVQLSLHNNIIYVNIIIACTEYCRARICSPVCDIPLQPAADAWLKSMNVSNRRTLENN